MGLGHVPGRGRTPTTIIRCKIYFKLFTVRVSSFNSFKCVIGNKKYKNSSPLRPYEN
jgi:hypothetical protein